MTWLPVLPLLTCLLFMLLSCLFWRGPLTQKIAHLVGAVMLLAATILVFIIVLDQQMLVTQIGGYAAPFGISFVIDKLSATMLLVTGVIGFCVALYTIYDIPDSHHKIGYYPMYWILLLGICGAFSTGDIFNLYVWFEIMLIASLVLLVSGNHKMQLDGTLKYVSINLVATILMLLAIAMLYAMTGTLNMADLSQKLSIYPLTGTVTSVVLLLTLAFSIKSALFPLFFWLPASYHTTNTATSALFAGMLTKVGVYSLIRLLTLVWPGNTYILFLLLLSACMTMLTGVLGAASQFHFRRLLSFHIISQVGYMVLGLAIYTPLALAGCVFYVVHHIIVKTNLFLISGICCRIGKSSDIRQLGGFYQNYPWLALLFFIPALSLAGLPPFSGFWAKLILLKAALNASYYVSAIISLLVSLLTLYSMTKIWTQVFWITEPKHKERDGLSLIKSGGVFAIAPVILLAAITLSMSIFPRYYFDIMQQIAFQLVNPQIYIHYVMG